MAASFPEIVLEQKELRVNSSLGALLAGLGGGQKTSDDGKEKDVSVKKPKILPIPKSVEPDPDSGFDMNNFENITDWSDLGGDRKRHMSESAYVNDLSGANTAPMGSRKMVARDDFNGNNRANGTTVGDNGRRGDGPHLDNDPLKPRPLAEIKFTDTKFLDSKFKDNDEEDEWFIEENERMAALYGQGVIHVKRSKSGTSIAYCCEICSTEMNKNCLDLHLGGMKHLKKKDTLERLRNSDGVSAPVRSVGPGPGPGNRGGGFTGSGGVRDDRAASRGFAPNSQLREDIRDPYSRDRPDVDPYSREREQDLYARDRLDPYGREKFDQSYIRRDDPYGGRPLGRDDLYGGRPPTRDDPYYERWILAESARLGEMRDRVLDPIYAPLQGRSPLPPQILRIHEEKLAGGPTGSLLQKLADCCVKNDDDAELASNVIQSLLKSLKEYNQKRGELKLADLLNEAELRITTVKASKVGLNSLGGNQTTHMQPASVPPQATSLHAQQQLQHHQQQPTQSNSGYVSTSYGTNVGYGMPGAPAGPGGPGTTAGPGNIAAPSGPGASVATGGQGGLGVSGGPGVVPVQAQGYAYPATQSYTQGSATAAQGYGAPAQNPNYGQYQQAAAYAANTYGSSQGYR